MIIDNKIDKTIIGPSVFLGITFFVIGIILLISNSWVFGLMSLMIALFLFFSYSGIDIDTEKRAIKSYNKYFGIFKSGKWEPLENYIGLTLVPMRKIYTVYSRSNQRNTSEEKEFRIYLVNKSKKPAIPVKKCKTITGAKNSIEEFSIWLKMPVYSISRG